MLSTPGICTPNASITPSRFDNQRWSRVFPHRLRGQGLPCLRQLSLSSPTSLSSRGKCGRWARCPSSSVIQWHLTYVPPSLSVTFVPVHPTMPTDVCCWRDKKGIPKSAEPWPGLDVALLGSPVAFLGWCPSTIIRLKRLGGSVQL